MKNSKNSLRVSFRVKNPVLTQRLIKLQEREQDRRVAARLWAFLVQPAPTKER